MAKQYLLVLAEHAKIFAIRERREISFFYAQPQLAKKVLAYFFKLMGGIEA